MRASVVALSVAAHAVAVGALAVWVLPDLPVPAIASETAPRVELTPAAPIEVVLLPEPLKASVPSQTPSRPRGPQLSSSASGPRDETVSTVERVPDSGRGASEPGGNAYMKMRGPDLGLPADKAEAIAAGGKPLAAPTAESGRLQQEGRDFRVPDLQVPATVSEDGRVTFHDKPAADIHWRIHLPTARGLGDALALWYADPYAQTQGRPVQELSKVDQAVDGGWDSGTGVGEGNAPITFNDKAYSKSGQPQIPIAGGALDLTSWAMRHFHVGDPYASRKRKILAATFDERVDIRARHVEHQLDHASEIMQKNVARLWAGMLSDAEKREGLFELWDECAEGDDPSGQAGARARAIVYGFIRSHATFTPAEIAAFDARRTSQQHFAP